MLTMMDSSEGDVTMVMVMMSMMCCVCFSRKSTGSILFIGVGFQSQALTFIS